MTERPELNGCGDTRRRLKATRPFVVACLRGVRVHLDHCDTQTGITRSTAPPGPADRLFMAVSVSGLASTDSRRGKRSACWASPVTARCASHSTFLPSGDRWQSSCFCQFRKPRHGYVHAVLEVSGERFGGLTTFSTSNWPAGPASSRPGGHRRRLVLWHLCGWGSPHGKVALLGPPFPAQAWVSTDGPSFEALVFPIAGRGPWPSINIAQLCRSCSTTNYRRGVPRSAVLSDGR